MVRRHFEPALEVIEQLTYLLFIKRLDELQTLKENKAARTGSRWSDAIFPTARTPRSGRMTTSAGRVSSTAPEEMFKTVQRDVFPFISSANGHDGPSELPPTRIT